LSRKQNSVEISRMRPLEEHFARPKRVIFVPKAAQKRRCAFASRTGMTGRKPCASLVYGGLTSSCPSRWCGQESATAWCRPPWPIRCAQTRIYRGAQSARMVSRRRSNRKSGYNAVSSFGNSGNGFPSVVERIPYEIARNFLGGK
jgi:hypothetical protein